MRRMMIAMRRMTIALIGAAALLSAALLVLVLVVAPAVPASAGTAGTRLRGTVTAGSTPLGGVAVGFWTAAGSRVALTRTSPDGSFALIVTSRRAGFVAAGAAPTRSRAVFTVGAAHLVRGVVGAGRTVAVAALTKPATASAIAARGDLRLRLQGAGRLTGSSARFGGTGDDRGEVHLLRTNGGEVDVASATDDGRVTTTWVVPGTYDLQLFPQPPSLRRTLRDVVVRTGTTDVDIDGVTRGATLTGTVTVGGAADTELIQAEVYRGSTLVDAFRTDAHGHWTLPAVAAGDVTIRFGATEVTGDDDEGAPPPPTADSALPKVVRVHIGADHRDRTIDVDLTPAGRLTGRLTGAPGARVILESASGRVVRVGDAGDDRTFSFGGLVPGRTYRVIGAGSLHHSPDPADVRYGARTVTAATGTTAIGDLAVDHVAATVRGTVAGLRSGRVVATEVGYTSTRTLTAAIGSDGSYAVVNALPGLWRLHAESLHHLAGGSRIVIVHRAPVRRDLVPGAVPATFRARFGTGTTGVLVEGSAVGTTGRRFDVYQPDGSGRVVAEALQAGDYTLAAFGSTVPARDGPWWFVAPNRSFVLRAGQPTDLGTVPLRIAG